MYAQLHQCPKIVLLALLLVCVSCGRKQRTIFHFAVTPPVKINKLELPIARGLQAVHHNHAIKLTWHPITLDQFPQTSPGLKLIGYNIYRLTQRHLVPKKAINKFPITTNSYIDTKKKNRNRSYCYLVRGIFKINEHQILGPVSHIICTVLKQ